MSRVRTGHGPQDWDVQEPAEMPFEARFLRHSGPGMAFLGGALVTSQGHKPPTGLAQLTPSEHARRLKRAEADKLARLAARLQR